jgi:hypothetical protein
MQPWVATLISAGVVILINLGTAAYVYGKLTQNVSTLSEDMKRQERRLNGHADEINHQGQRISTIEGQLKPFKL